MTNSPIDHAVISELKEATGNEFAAELVTTFLDEAPSMITALRTAAVEADPDGYRRAAHSLKSNADTFGAYGLADLARKMELGDLPDADQSTRDIDALNREFDRAASALKELV